MKGTSEEPPSQAYRRLMAVLHADAAGFTRQTENDEDWTYSTLREFRTVFLNYIAEHRGQVRSLGGDDVLAEFSSTVDAVLAAGAIQSELAKRNLSRPRHRRLEFRIGIHAGEAVADADGIFGDVVNVAARIQKHAPPGEVCVSALVRTLAGQRLPLVQYRPHFDQRVRNHSDSVEVYRVVWPDAEALSSHENSNSSRSPQLEQRPSVGVLILEDRTNDHSFGFIGESLAEDVISQLSRFRTISVLGVPIRHHGSTGSSLSHIASENGVHYLVRGSIVRSEKRLRISVQLIDGDSEKAIWGEQYHELADCIFDRQREVVRRIVSALAKRISEDRHRRSEVVNPRALKAWDLCDRGEDLSYCWKQEGDRQALEYFLRAIEVDPSYARAHAGAGVIYQSRNLISPGNPTNNEDLKRAGLHLMEAVRLDNLDSRNHMYLGWWYLLNRQFDDGERHFERAGELNPHDSTTLIARAQACAYLGLPQEAMAMAAQALDLAPYHPPDYYHVYLASIYFVAQDYERTLAAVASARTLLPEVGAWKAAANVHLGRMQDAVVAASEFLSQVRERWSGKPNAEPQQIIDWLDEILFFKKSRDRQHLYDALSSAGLPRPSGNITRQSIATAPSAWSDRA